MLRHLISLFCSLAIINTSLAQCTTGSGSLGYFAPGTFAMRAYTAPAVEGKTIAGDTANVYIFRDGVQIGAVNVRQNYYLPLVDAQKREWGEPIALSVEKKPHLIGDLEPEPKKEPMPPTGVEKDKLSDDPRITINGRSIATEEAIRIIKQQPKRPEIPDDTTKLRVTVIGSESEAAPFLAAWKQMDAAIASRCIVWTVPADHWCLTDTATGKTIYKTDGHPTIYLQGPDGKVWHRQDGFAGVGDLEAIRQGVKNYDAAKDPDLRNPQPSPGPLGPLVDNPDNYEPLLPAAGLAGLAAVAMLLKRKGKF